MRKTICNMTCSNKSGGGAEVSSPTKSERKTAFSDTFRRERSMSDFTYTYGITTT